MPRAVKGPWSAVDLEAAVAAAVEGETYSAVEKRTGFPAPTIRNHLLRRGSVRKSESAGFAGGSLVWFLMPQRAEI